jgi:ubiquinone/menaquinone biosynthesis C-methylase UbiE
MKKTESQGRNENRGSSLTYDRIHFMLISLVHDKLYRLFVNPYTLLYAAGIRVRQKVLEVGFGPGFFTIPAAKIVGEEGSICALDINPVAVETVRRKVKENKVSNVKVMLADANETGLPNNNFDVAFLFGVIQDFRDVGAVMREMHRVLKEKGVLSVQKSSRSERDLMDIVTKNHLFVFRDKSGGIFRFSKNASRELSASGKAACKRF